MVANLKVESTNYDTLFTQLQSELGEQLGQTVQLLPEGARVGKSLGDVIVRRARDLRAAERGYDDIAVKLNIEGFKLETGVKFTGSTVKALLEAA